ncbi:GDP-mannose 4,6-dehydratase [Leptothoe sp. EHU-05/26/07-4]
MTGGAGFIDSNFVHHFHGESGKIIVLDALTYTGNRSTPKDFESQANFQLTQEDICNQQLVDDLLTTHEIDTVVHFAAESHVVPSIPGPVAFV